MMRRLAAHERVTPLSAACAPPEPPREAQAASSELSQAVARLLAEERALAPERIRGLLERELARFRGDRSVSLHVHPSDRARLPASEALSEAFALREPLLIHEDPTLEPGGFILRSPRGEVDVRVETQVVLALSSLLGAGA